MKRTVLIALVVCAGVALGQQITVMVAPFDSSKAGDPEIGKKVSVILNLQIWQTLRIPATGEGCRVTRGTFGAVDGPAVRARSRTDSTKDVVYWVLRATPSSPRAASRGRRAR